MFKNTKLLLSYLSFFLLCATLTHMSILSAYASQTVQELDSAQLAETLQNTYSKLTSLEFNFTQVTRTGGRERHGAGNAVFYRSTLSPEKNVQTNSVMRWNYTSPDEQIITNDGETLSIYTKKDQQILMTPANELESDITFAFLSGSKKLLDDFLATKPNDRFSFSIPGKDIRGLQLIPRTPHSQVKAIHMWFDDTFVIHNLIIEDHFDSVTELIFTNILLDKIPADNPRKVQEILHFPIPAGTEIISQ